LTGAVRWRANGVARGEQDRNAVAAMRKDEGMDRPLVVAAVASEPNGVTIWRTVREYFRAHGQPMDYCLFSTYDAMERALLSGAIDIAWNAPLAQAKTLVHSGGACRVLAMRDTDREVATILLTRADGPVHSVGDLKGRRVALGEAESSELSILPSHMLRQEGVDLSRDCTLVDLPQREYPGGEAHVEVKTLVAALEDGVADAVTMFEPYWRALVDRGRMDESAFRVAWRSRQYSHCGFAARPGLPEDVGRRFVELLASMDYGQPDIKEMMDLEHLRAWVPADESGWKDLVAAIRGEGKAAPV
jgi:ABC-type phosphate/phosphonate transport system substrate-binding protein